MRALAAIAVLFLTACSAGGPLSADDITSDAATSDAGV
jgi:hypothetical protein